MSKRETAFPHDAERDVRKHLKARLETLGGTIRKIGWINRRSAPDELILIPRLGVHFIAELKRPGAQPTPAQWREIQILRDSGLRVEVLSTREQVDAALNWDLI